MYNIVIECVGSFFDKSLLKFVKHAKNFLKNDSERVRPIVCHFRVPGIHVFWKSILPPNSSIHDDVNENLPSDKINDLHCDILVNRKKIFCSHTCIKLLWNGLRVVNEWFQYLMEFREPNNRLMPPVGHCWERAKETVRETKKKQLEICKNINFHCCWDFRNLQIKQLKICYKSEIY